jgi:hypothetical protein
MNAFVIGVVIVSAMFADMVVEVSAEITTDIFLDDDAGTVSEVIPEPRSDIVNMMPDAGFLTAR